MEVISCFQFSGCNSYYLDCKMEAKAKAVRGSGVKIDCFQIPTKDKAKLCQMVKLPYSQYRNVNKKSQATMICMFYSRAWLISRCVLAVLRCIYIRTGERTPPRIFCNCMCTSVCRSLSSSFPHAPVSQGPHLPHSLSLFLRLSLSVCLSRNLC